MTANIDYAQNRSNSTDIERHLQACDHHFLPPLSTRVDLAAYAGKLVQHAARFEAWSAGTLAGLVAAYCNDGAAETAFITNVSVLPEWHGHGLARHLLGQCVQAVDRLGMKHIDLEVSCGNIAAINLYKKLGFITQSTENDALRMRLTISKDHKA